MNYILVRIWPFLQRFYHARQRLKIKGVERSGASQKPLILRTNVVGCGRRRALYLAELCFYEQFPLPKSEHMC